MHATPSQGRDRYPTIRWTHEPKNIQRILDYCERHHRSRPKGRYEEARNTIIERLYGNLLHANRKGYPSEISFDTVARQLTNHCDETLAGQATKAGYIAALESEWDRMRELFVLRFNPDK